MAPSPAISIVIPAYNYGRLLRRAVHSVALQMTHAHELVVVNDGSTDDTAVVLEALVAELRSGLKVLEKQNGGSSSARNAGIDAAAGDYLIFLDADDELLPGALQKIEQHLVQHPESKFVICGHRAVTESGKSREHIPVDVPKDAYERLKGYLIDKSFGLSNGACVMHRDVFRWGRYPEQFRSAEDVPVFAQALANVPCSVLPEAILVVHKHSDSLRHQYRHAKAGGLSLVDEIFSEARLPLEYRGLRSAYELQRCLSLFRSAYLAGEHEDAIAYFRLALERDWRAVLRPSYVGKFCRMAMRRRASSIAGYRR